MTAGQDRLLRALLTGFSRKAIMANGSKRFHSKSRNGCGQCKRRRVRCNCQGPVCSNCQRRNEFCDYLRDYNSQSPEVEAVRRRAQIPLFQSNHASLPRKVTTFVEENPYLSSCADLVVSLECSPISAKERELLAHTTAFFLRTDWAPSTLPQGDYDYQSKKLGYLLPTISSLCAIHSTLQRNPQSSNTYAKAVQHHINASARFRHAERGVHEGNWLPILMFGIGHIMFNFAAAQSMPDCDFDFLGIFHVLRGTAEIGDQIGVFLEKSKLHSILERRRRGIGDPSAPDDIMQAIDQLSLAQHPEGTYEATRTHCEHAAETLKWWARFVNAAPYNWKHFILWPASVTDGFVTALREKQPVALLVYIYWCVVMHRAPRRWYSNKWHHRVAVAAMSNIGPEYRTLLECPSLALNLPLVADISSSASTDF
ncbi:hypothetical protein F5B21DRAFT_494343 [Xylaria acuta]|nr:hypothetical protein F5B21DRAFT_494343 [Xylaria acuta]